MVRTLRLHPKHFGPSMMNTISLKIQEEYEGTCTGEHGFVVMVLLPELSNIGAGLVDPSTIKFQAVVCRPMKGEVLDCTVTLVNKVGFFAGKLRNSGGL